MICPLCGNQHAIVIAKAGKDKYLSFIELPPNYMRVWYQCTKCQLLYQNSSLSEEQLELIYSNYRDSSIRNAGLKQLFDQVITNPESENSQRVNLLVSSLPTAECINCLDIGSGFGVFPYLLKKQLGIEVDCLEANRDSVTFIRKLGGLPCYEGFYPNVNLHGIKYDLITMVHILEHFAKPRDILTCVRNDLHDDGWLFIEVPSATEFDYLPPDHDEFNSLHLCMFSKETLSELISSSMFKIEVIKQIHYKERNLDRICLLAQKC